jgi:membrane protein YdbS with pleckstrin-like domain
MSFGIIGNFMEQKTDHNLPDKKARAAAAGIGDPVLIIAEAAPVDMQPNALVSAALESDPVWYSLDDRHVRLEQVLGAIVWAVIFVAGLVGFGIWFFANGPDWIFWLSFGCGLGAAGFLLWVFLCWPAIAHRHARWRLDETGLEIRRGVFWKHQISVPLARLQHADIGQGPVQRRYGLAKLTVHTAGSANASVELDGLAIETATWLRDMLIRQKEAQDVV